MSHNLTAHSSSTKWQGRGGESSFTQEKRIFDSVLSPLLATLIKSMLTLQIVSFQILWFFVPGESLPRNPKLLLQSHYIVRTSFVLGLRYRRYIQNLFTFPLEQLPFVVYKLKQLRTLPIGYAQSESWFGMAKCFIKNSSNPLLPLDSPFFAFLWKWLSPGESNFLSQKLTFRRWKWGILNEWASFLGLITMGENMEGEDKSNSFLPYILVIIPCLPLSPLEMDLSFQTDKSLLMEKFSFWFPDITHFLQEGREMEAGNRNRWRTINGDENGKSF